MWDIISTEIILTLRTRLEHKRKIDLTPLFQPSQYLFNKIFVQPQQTYQGKEDTWEYIHYLRKEIEIVFNFKRYMSSHKNVYVGNTYNQNLLIHNSPK